VDGTVEIYGVEIDHERMIEPKKFAGIDDEFMTTFDQHAGR